MLWTTFVMALRQMLRNKVRTGLTSLGILIGVAAVISMVSIGTSAARSVEADLSQFGDDLMFIVPGQRGDGPPRPVEPFQHADVAALRDLEGVGLIAPYSATRMLVVAGERSWTTLIEGHDTDLLTMVDISIVRGRYFEPAEERAGASVCLLGETVWVELFGADDPLGREIRIGDVTCTVVGLQEPRGTDTFGNDQDDSISMPLATFQRRIQGNRDIAMIFVKPAAGTTVDELTEEIELLMRQRRRVPDDMDSDFEVQNMAEIQDILGGISAVLTGFLAAIAAVSLLVGGIGIMNIMLVSVTERTREIGIRMAIGALARDVMLQFLVEAMVLSAAGGLVGIGFGLLMSWGAAKAMGMELIVDPLVVTGAFLFSGLIGIVFGFFPARRAAKMKPIDALRHE